MSRARTVGLVAASAILFVAGGLATARAGVKPEQVPTFRWRARVVTSGGAAPADAVYRYTLGGTAESTGSQWSAWSVFGRPEAEKAVGPHSYPNDHMRGFPVVQRLAIGGIKDPSAVEAELVFDEGGATFPLTGDLYAGSLGVLLWREADGSPRAATMAEYNRRYWSALGRTEIPPDQRPTRFPIVDRFIAGDSDRTALREGILNLSKGGFSALMLGPDRRSRALLLETGLRRTAWAVYNPPGYAFDHGPKTSPEEVAAWAAAEAAPFTNAGFAVEDMAAFTVSDEPGWYYPSAFTALTNNPAALARFRDYVRSQGLSARDVGRARWEDVMPLARSGAVDLPSKRLFYWTMRFFAWDSARHFAACTRALEQAFYTNMPIIVNWNFFSGRLYVPGPVANNGAKTDPDAAMGGHDWLEFGRMRGCTMLWTEDWFGDDLAYQWSYYCARLRRGAEMGGVDFGGYVIPRTAGQREDGILQKILTLVGSGGKAVKYFVFGPEYVFPGNCYSENVKVLPKMAEAHRMIGAAEDLLWPGRRPRPQAAILMPRSAQMWDLSAERTPRAIEDATNVHLNRRTVDYMAETYDLYLALQHANVPADVIDEDDLTEKGLAPYRVVYVTEPNVPAEGQRGLAAWTARGGTVVTVSGAAQSGRYGEPCDLLAEATGIREEPRERLPVGDVRALPVAGKVAAGDSSAEVIGPRSSLAKGAKMKLDELARFDDGTPAVVSRLVGKGRAVAFLFMPGLSYARSPAETRDGLSVGWSAALREWIVQPALKAGVVRPVETDRPLVETPLLASDKGLVVTLLNWTGEPVESLPVTVRTDRPVAAVESVLAGKLAFERVEGGVSFRVPIKSADFVMLRPQEPKK